MRKKWKKTTHTFIPSDVQFFKKKKMEYLSLHSANASFGIISTHPKIPLLDMVELHKIYTTTKMKNTGIQSYVPTTGNI